MPDLLKEYRKPPKTIDEQIDLLINRGLIVDDKEELRYYLKNINYYHLSIYFKYYQKDDRFYEGIKFTDVLRIYKFDNKLRFLLLELLERIEKSFKSRLAYELSIKSGSAHWYLDENYFINSNKYEEILKIISEEVGKSKEMSISHYKETYNNPVLPPIWNVVEILSFGQCVKFCSNLKREYKNKISRTYGDDEKFVLNWLYVLSLLRNNCAHHSRLWNKIFNFTPNKSHDKYKQFFSNNEDVRLFDCLIVLQIMLSKVNPTSGWLLKLKEYLEEFKINPKNMGFPDNWEDRLNKII